VNVAAQDGGWKGAQSSCRGQYRPDGACAVAPETRISEAQWKRWTIGVSQLPMPRAASPAPRIDSIELAAALQAPVIVTELRFIQHMSMHQADSSHVFFLHCCGL